MKPLNLAIQKNIKKIAVDSLDLPARLATKKNARKRNVLITAIPRSGSSLFIKLLNQIPDCVALNELSTTSLLYSFFFQLRMRIAYGLPIPNKYSTDGTITSNTIDQTTHLERHVIDIKKDRLLLAHKNTVPYLSRIEDLVKTNWQIWVLVRHPLYTLSSWKRCPDHFTITRLNPPHKALAHIKFSSEDLDIRRIEVWNHYAQRIDALKDKLNIVRYEDLIADVNKTMARFCQIYELEKPDFEPLESRNKKGVYKGLDEHLKTLVNERCESWRFGYSDKP